MKIAEKDSKTYFFIAAFFIEALCLAVLLFKPLHKFIHDTGPAFNVNNPLVVFLLFATLAAYALISKTDLEKIGFKAIFSFLILFSATLLWVWPIGSFDILSYISQGRILSVHRENPMANAFADFVSDEHYHNLTNINSSQIFLYGPLFVGISAFLSWLRPHDLLLTLFFFKLFFIIINIANALLVKKITGSLRAFTLYAFNPVLLFEFAVSGHNDSLMIFFILLSFYSLRIKTNRQHLLSALFLSLAVMVKIFAALLVPVFLVYLMRGGASKPEIAMPRMISSALLIFSVFALSYLPFLRDGELIRAVWTHTSRYFGYIVLSPLYFFPLLLLHYFNREDLVPLFTNCGKIFFIASFSFLIFKLIKKRQPITDSGLAFFYLIALSLFFLLFTNWYMPWYGSVLIVLLIIGYSNRKYPDWVHWAIPAHAVFCYTLLLA